MIFDIVASGGESIYVSIVARRSLWWVKGIRQAIAESGLLWDEESATEGTWWMGWITG